MVTEHYVPYISDIPETPEEHKASVRGHLLLMHLSGEIDEATMSEIGRMLGIFEDAS